MTRRHGIILAAGDASRLPDKPLLPLRDGRPAICSGIDLLLRSDCNEVTVVTQPRSVIPRVLARNFSGLRFAVQQQPVGVMDAICCGLPHSECDALVTFCDNVFEESESVPKHLFRHASVRTIASPGARAQLDYWDGGWRVRRDNLSSSALCFAGWMVMPSRKLWCCRSGSLIQCFNEHDVQPVHVHNKQWWDSGTPETYRNYWGIL
jgi:hypothetical protein